MVTYIKLISIAQTENVETSNYDICLQCSLKNWLQLIIFIYNKVIIDIYFLNVHNIICLM